MKKQLSPEIEAAIAALYRGAPLGEVAATLTEINERAIVESYRSGLSLRKCAPLHGVRWHQAENIIHRREPGLMRINNRMKGEAARAEGRES